MKRKILRLIMIFYCITLLFPNIAYDYIIEYNHFKNYYKWLTPKIYFHILSETKKYQNILTSDIIAMIQMESGNYCNNNFRKMCKVISYAGAVGMMQVMPSTAKKNIEELQDPLINIKCGIQYYSWCLNYAKGDKREALRFYNAGPFSKKERYKNWKYVDNIMNSSLQMQKIIFI